MRATSAFQKVLKHNNLVKTQPVCRGKKTFMPLRDADSITWKSSVNDCSTHAYLPVLDFKPLVQPPAEKQWLCRNFLYVHTLEVYVDPRTFFAQEFCQTQKIKRLNKNRKSLSAKRHVETAPTITTVWAQQRRDAGTPTPGISQNLQWHRVLICLTSVGLIYHASFIA